MKREQAEQNRQARIEGLQKQGTEDAMAKAAREQAIAAIHRARAIMYLPPISDAAAWEQHQQNERSLAEHERLAEVERRFKHGT